jgi:hypothetical protein
MSNAVIPSQALKSHVYRNRSFDAAVSAVIIGDVIPCRRKSKIHDNEIGVSQSFELVTAVKKAAHD